MSVSRRDRSHKLYRFVLAAFALIALASCQQPRALALHYVPAPRAAPVSFFPAKIAIIPPGVSGGKSRLNVGAAYNAEGYVEARYAVDDVGRQVAEVVAQALEHAGLRPIVLAGPPPGNVPPFGVDFLLTCELKQLQCIKRLVAGRAGAEGHFTMTADVGLHLTLSIRRGVLYDDGTDYAAHEPPEGVDAATYQPQVTDPAQALSIALSRATETLMAQSGFRAALPQRAIPEPERAATSTPTSAVAATPAISGAGAARANGSSATPAARR